MTGQWVSPDAVFDGRSLSFDKSVRIEDDRIVEIAAARPHAAPLTGCLTPGFVDLQVNGGGGVMLNTTPTRAGMAVMAKAHRQFGTVAILPTVITDSADVLDQAAQAALDTRGDANIIGLHIEGPHIAQARRGTHDPAFIRPLDDHTIATVKKLRSAGVPVMITLAPEAASLAQITALAHTGAVVSLGHTDATADQIEAAIAAGAHCATHLFNAMSPMQSRAPGTVGAVLASEIAFGLICDGHHVDDRMTALAMRLAAAGDRCFLISDAMATVGGPDHFALYGRTIHLENGRLINSEQTLAGAHLTMAQAVERATRIIGRGLEETLRMAITTPATLIGRPELAHLLGRVVSDTLMLDDKHSVIGPLSAVIDTLRAKPR